MTRLTRILTVAGAALALAAFAAIAADEAELPLGEKPQASVQKLVRHETLELPGVRPATSASGVPILTSRRPPNNAGWQPTARRELDSSSAVSRPTATACATS